MRLLVVLMTLATAFSAADAGDPPPGTQAPFECHLPFPDGASWKILHGNGTPPNNDALRAHAFDFAMQPAGQLVCAVADGVVEIAMADDADPAGTEKDDNFILIRHDMDKVSRYARLQKGGVFVTVGEKVLAGDVIGLSGTMRNSDAPHLHFGLRRDKDGPSIPCKFVDVEGDGVPKDGQTVTSQNIVVRQVPGYRQTRDAIDLFHLCEQIGATGCALPLLETARKSPPKVQHASVTALLSERDEVLEAHRLAAADAAQTLKNAKEAKDVSKLAELATFTSADFADVPALSKEMRGLVNTYGKDPEWAAAMARFAGRTEFRALVAAAIKEETSAGSRFVLPKKFDPKARPDYANAILAWEKARGRAPEQDQGSAVRRHAEALKKGPR